MSFKLMLYIEHNSTWKNSFKWNT